MNMHKCHWSSSINYSQRVVSSFWFASTNSRTRARLPTLDAAQMSHNSMRDSSLKWGKPSRRRRTRSRWSSSSRGSCSLPSRRCPGRRCWSVSYYETAILWICPCQNRHWRCRCSRPAADDTCQPLTSRGMTNTRRRLCCRPSLPVQSEAYKTCNRVKVLIKTF